MQTTDDRLHFKERFTKVSIFNIQSQFTEEAPFGIIGANGAFVQFAHGVASVGSAEPQKKFSFAVLVGAQVLQKRSENLQHDLISSVGIKKNQT